MQLLTQSSKNKDSHLHNLMAICETGWKRTFSATSIRFIWKYYLRLHVTTLCNRTYVICSSKRFSEKQTGWDQNNFLILGLGNKTNIGFRKSNTEAYHFTHHFTTTVWRSVQNAGRVAERPVLVGHVHLPSHQWFTVSSWDTIPTVSLILVSSDGSDIR